MLSATVVLDVKSDRSDREAGRLLHGVQSGQHVIVQIGDRRYAGHDLAAWLSDFIDTCHIELQGTPGAIEAWTRQILMGHKPTRVVLGRSA